MLSLVKGAAIVHATPQEKKLPGSGRVQADPTAAMQLTFGRVRDQQQAECLEQRTLACYGGNDDRGYAAHLRHLFFASPPLEAAAAAELAPVAPAAVDRKSSTIFAKATGWTPASSSAIKIWSVLRSRPVLSSCESSWTPAHAKRVARQMGRKTKAGSQRRERTEKGGDAISKRGAAEKHAQSTVAAAWRDAI